MLSNNRGKGTLLHFVIYLDAAVMRRFIYFGVTYQYINCCATLLLQNWLQLDAEFSFNSRLQLLILCTNIYQDDEKLLLR